MPPPRLSAALLAALVVSAAVAQPPAAPPPPAADKGKPQEWPKEFEGKVLGAFVKDLADPDPGVKVHALQTIPGFGPEAARKGAGKAVVKLLGDELSPRVAGDPAVIAAGFAVIRSIGLEEAEMKAVAPLLSTVVKSAGPGSILRYYAIGAFVGLGPKAPGLIDALTSDAAVRDPSHETRKQVAGALSVVGGDPVNGPSPLALKALTTYLISDKAVEVRMEAYQALVFLGPKYKAPAADPKVPPVIDREYVDKFYMTNLRNRLKPPAPPGTVGGGEKDEQVKVWARLAVMKFDPAEVNDANVNAVADLLKLTEKGARLQALHALRLLGPVAAKKVDAILATMKETDPVMVEGSIRALAGIGKAAGPTAVAALKALKDRPDLDATLKELADKAAKVVEGEGSPGSDSPPPATPAPAPPK